MRATILTLLLVAVGFASLGSLSSRFTQLVGESPVAYRNRWAATGGPHIPGCYLFMRGITPQSRRSRAPTGGPSVET